MSDLFQRELSPDQIHEALSLLDSAARANNRNLQVGDLSAADQDYPKADQTNTTRAMQDRLPAPEDPRQRKKPLHLALAPLRPWHRGRGGGADALVLGRSRPYTTAATNRSRAAPKPTGRTFGETRFSVGPGCKSYRPR